MLIDRTDKKIQELKDKIIQLQNECDILEGKYNENRINTDQTPHSTNTHPDAYNNNDTSNFSRNPNKFSNIASFKENESTVEDLLFYLKSILGFSITYIGNTITIRSVYSFASEDIFELEVLNNKLILKNTPYLLEWNDFFNDYIKNGRSYCAFFAAVTLELYNRKTFG